MSFPMRFWFYDKETDYLIDPGASFVGMELCVIPKGSVAQTMVEKDETIKKPQERFVPLASTGLEDSQGREIVEGHLLESATEHHEFFAVVEWSPNNSAFRKVWYDPERAAEGYEDWDIDEYGYRGSPLHTTYYLETSRVYGETTQEERVVGHALTDLDLAPNGFDVEEYFDLNNS